MKSAHSIITNMDKQKYDLVMIGISQQGTWLKYDGPVECLLDDTWNEGQHCTPAILSPDRNTHGLVEIHGDQVIYTPLDVVFPMLHGKYGEDGTMQGLLELAGIPYVGCRVPGSVLCMDKELAYRILQGSGIRTPHFRTINSRLDENVSTEPELDYPLFVKPANSGSSFGVTKVTQANELPTAIREAGKYDWKILIEQAVEGSEVGCAVLGCGNDLTVGEVDQIELSHGFFRIHQEAHPEVTSENSTVHVPARVAPEVRQ